MHLGGRQRRLPRRQPVVARPIRQRPSATDPSRAPRTHPQPEARWLVRLARSVLDALVRQREPARRRRRGLTGPGTRSAGGPPGDLAGDGARCRAGVLVGHNAARRTRPRRLFRIKRPSCRNWLAFAALQPQMAKRPASEMWSEMAAEVRAMAERTRHPRDRTRLLEIAASYDKLAARAAEMERRVGGQGTEDPTAE
jgi:hypothetical protein